MQCHGYSFLQQKGNLLLPTIEQRDGRMQINSVLTQKYLYIKAIERNAVKLNRGETLKQMRQGTYVYERAMKGQEKGSTWERIQVLKIRGET